MGIRPDPPLAAPAASKPVPAGGARPEERLDPAGRDRIPGARTVVPVGEREDPAALAALEARAVASASLERRGCWHGEWIELDPAREVPDREESSGERWHAARPLVLPRIAAAGLEGSEGAIEAALDLHGELQEKGGLRRWLGDLAPDLAPGFRLLPRAGRLSDPERDLELALLASPSPGGRGRAVLDLWVKSAWLSTHPGEDSLRLRVSFGREREDDASRDLLRHRLVAELAGRLLPECALATANPELALQVERLIAEPPLLTQPIAYWNSPGGGALFHHDAFAEDEEEPGRPGQRGVCYLQLSGRTAWLALSIADLARRVREFAAFLEAGGMPWVRTQVLADPARLRRVRELQDDEARLLFELALPGCGVLAGLVNRGPEFTAFLAAGGHACLLSPGDAILLPSHGLASTAMHSVFCAGDETAYGISFAIRPDREDAAFAGEPARPDRRRARGTRRR